MKLSRNPNVSFIIADNTQVLSHILHEYEVELNG